MTSAFNIPAILRTGTKGIIFDLDHTLYRAPDNEHEIVCNASAATAIRLGFKGTRKEAIRIISRAWHENHDDGGIVLSRDHGVDRNAFMRLRHQAMLPEFKSFLSPDPALTTAFNRLGVRYDIAVLTHGTEEWAAELTPHLGYNIPRDRIFGLDSLAIAFRKKSDGPEAYLAVAREMGLEPSELATADDNVFNLAQAARAGIQPLHIIWDAPQRPLIAGISTQIPSIAHIY